MSISVKELVKLSEGLSILYVEDEGSVANETASILRLIFREVYIGRDGQEGIDLFNKFKPNVVMTDIIMPKKDGLTMSKYIRSIDNEIPIIFTTAFNETNMLLTALDIGVDKYLLKPISKEKLINVLNPILTNIKTKKELIKTQACFEKAMELANMGSWEWELNKDRIWYSDNCYKIFEEDKCENLRFTDGKLYENIHINDRESVKLSIENSLDKNIPLNTSFRYSTKSGKEKILHISDVAMQDDKHFATRKIGIIQDITKVENEKVKLIKAASNDLLTGLMNKTLFNIFLKKQYVITKRYSHDMSLILFNIDNFKVTNNILGHINADLLIVEVVRLISRNIRQSDIFARLEGVEFAILAPKCNLYQVRVIVTKLVDTIAKYKFTNTQQRVVCNFAATELYQDDTIISFMNRAEQAFNKVKVSKTKILVVGRVDENSKKIKQQ